jgi:8-oxo-dGTP pyrophosphatase MutT (NUDIX family)
VTRAIGRLEDVTFADGSVAHVELFLSSTEAKGDVFAAMVVLSDAARQYAVVYSPRRKEWSAPGGWLEPGETAVEGAVREVLEETGIRLHADALEPWGYERYEPVSIIGRWPRAVSCLQVYRATIPETSPPLTTSEPDAVGAEWVSAALFAERCADRFWWPIVADAVTQT